MDKFIVTWSHRSTFYQHIFLHHGITHLHDQIGKYLHLQISSAKFSVEKNCDFFIVWSEPLSVARIQLALGQFFLGNGCDIFFQLFYVRVSNIQ